MKLKKTTELKSIADTLFRKYLLSIATSHMDKLKCFISDRFFYAENLHVCHYISRSCIPLRYNTDNCHLCNSKSNMWDSKIYDKENISLHHKQYKEKLGELTADKLSKIKSDNMYSFYGREYYLDIIDRLNFAISNNTKFENKI